MTGNISKTKGFKGPRGDIGPQGPRGEQGPQGLKGEKGDSPAIVLRYDEETGNLYYDSDGILLDKEYVKSQNLATKEYVDNVVGSINPDETDPTVPEWAKQPNKPTYTPAEIGTLSATQITEQITQTVEEQTESIRSDVEGIQKQINEHAHFKGYKATNAEILELEATPNDFAYSAESGTKWIYSEEDGWQDSGVPVPDQLTPASNATPLVNGEATAGTSEEYARGDHRHPTDTTRLSVVEFNEFKTELETSLDNIITKYGLGGDVE